MPGFSEFYEGVYYDVCWRREGARVEWLASLVLTGFVFPTEYVQGSLDDVPEGAEADALRQTVEAAMVKHRPVSVLPDDHPFRDRGLSIAFFWDVLEGIAYWWCSLYRSGRLIDQLHGSVPAAGSDEANEAAVLADIETAVEMGDWPETEETREPQVARMSYVGSWRPVGAEIHWQATVYRDGCTEGVTWGRFDRAGLAPADYERAVAAATNEAIRSGQVLAD